MDIKRQILSTCVLNLKYLHLMPRQHSMITYIVFIIVLLLRLMFVYFSFLLILAGLEHGNVIEFADGFAAMVGHAHGFKVCILFDQKGLERTLSAINDFWISDSTKRTDKYLLLFARTFRIFICISLTAIVYAPAILLKELPFPGIIPDFEGSYGIFSTLQCIQYSYDATVVAVTDSLFVVMVFLIISQMKLLNQRIREIGNNLRTGNASQKEIIECIKYHDHLLKLCKELINYYKGVLALQLFMTTVGTGLEALAFSNRTINGKIARLFYINIVLVQLALYCVPAEWLSNECALTSDFIFYTRWYENKYFSRTYVRTIIQTAQIPVTFTAGGVIAMNFSTFVLVFQNFLSINAVLKDLSSG